MEQPVSPCSKTQSVERDYAIKFLWLFMDLNSKLFYLSFSTNKDIL